MAETMEEIKDEDGNVVGEVPVVTLDDVAFNPSEALKSAIQSGHVTTKKRTVEFSAKDKDKNPTKVFRQSYTQCTAVNKAGALVLPGIDGDENELWKLASRSADALVYQPVYVRLKNAAAGPEKAIEKAMKALSGLTSEELNLAKAAFKEAGISL